MIPAWTPGPGGMSDRARPRRELGRPCGEAGECGFADVAVVSATALWTPVRDEDHASADARWVLTALPHPWKAGVAPRLSPSMRGGIFGVRRGIDSALLHSPAARIEVSAGGGDRRQKRKLGSTPERRRRARAPLVSGRLENREPRHTPVASSSPSPLLPLHCRLTRTEPRSRTSSRLAAFSQSNFAIHSRSVVVPSSPNPSRPRYEPPA
jgi:hypothetical protein